MNLSETAYYLRIASVILLIFTIIFAQEFNFEIGFFTLLRIVLSLDASLQIYLNLNISKKDSYTKLWLISDFIILLIFQPIFPLYFSIETWLIVDVIALCYLITNIIFSNRQFDNSDQTQPKNSPDYQNTEEKLNENSKPYLQEINPPRPDAVGDLLTNSIDTIIELDKKYLNKTKIYFEEYENSGDIEKFFHAITRYVAHTSCALIGVAHFYSNRTVDEYYYDFDKLIELIYGYQNVFIIEFSWSLFVYAIEKHPYKSEFSQDELVSYMNNDSCMQLLIATVFRYISGTDENAEYAYEKYIENKEYINGDNKLKLKFDKVTENANEDLKKLYYLNLIGDVGRFKLFDTMPFDNQLTRRNSQSLERLISGIEDTYIFKMFNEII